MTISAEYINQIVQNVMREMQTRVTQVDAGRAVKNQTTGADPLQIGSRVISESTLLAADAAGRAVSLPAGAVITPSGRDFIRRNGVRLASQLAGKAAVADMGTLISVGHHTTSISAASAAGWKTRVSSTEFEAALFALEHLSSGIVTCCGGEPAVVACLLNRNSAVRSAVVTRSTNLAALITVMNPQVVCLDSAGWSFGDVLRLLRGLSAVSVNTPMAWKELAGGPR